MLYMIVGEDVTLAADDDAGAEAGLDFLAGLGKTVTEKMLEDRVIQQGMDASRNDLGCMHVDHGRCRLINGIDAQIIGLHVDCHSAATPDPCC